MSKNNLIAALDIGTHTVKLLLVNKKKEEEKPEVITLVQEPSFGVRRGVVIKPETVSEIIRIIVDKIKSETGRKINSVYLNIGGSHLFSTSSRGTVSVSRADGRVSREDVKRVIEAAKTFPLPFNREILEIIPKEFIIDGQGEIKDVVGLQGVRLETDVIAIGGFEPYKKNLVRAILDCDLQILDIIPSAISAAIAVLSPRQKELGVCLLDIGGGTTSLAVFEEGNLTYLSVLPMGSANITNDIAIALKTDVDTAEIIKIKLGSCILKGGWKKEKIEIEGEEPLIFSQKTLVRVIEARMAEIFQEVKKELKKIEKLGLLPAGIVLTGGGANLPSIVELAKKEFKLPCRIGKPQNFPDLESNPNLATVCGLVMRGIELAEENQRGPGFAPSGIKEKIKNFFKIFLP